MRMTSREMAGFAFKAPPELFGCQVGRQYFDRHAALQTASRARPPHPCRPGPGGIRSRRVEDIAGTRESLVMRFEGIPLICWRYCIAGKPSQSTRARLCYHRFMFRGLLFTLLPLALFAQPARDLRVEPNAVSNPLRDRGTRWALVIGVSSYEFVPPAAQLHFAHRDAEDFAAFLRSSEGGALPGDHIRLLTNEKATLAQIRAGLHTWLVDSARPEDIVYVFFAGHGVLDDQDEGYLVAHDSDPQNLHATAISFQEVNNTLSDRLRAALVVMVTDACHAGRLGWSSYSPNAPNGVNEPLARIGRGDRSFLKLLASKPSELSFEDAQWDGGHGAFTHALLEGLRGAADLDGDHVIRASEAIDFASHRVAEITNALQHPRVAGVFDARLAIAVAPQSAPPAARGVPMEISGPAGSALYLDSISAARSARGRAADLVSPGAHGFSADFPDGTTLDGSITLGGLPARDVLRPTPASSAVEAASRRRTNPGAQRAWDLYRASSPGPPAGAAEMISGALEELGRPVVITCNPPPPDQRGDAPGATDAYQHCRTATQRLVLEPRRLFCSGRLQIAEGRFWKPSRPWKLVEARPRFACAYNALGVALSD